MKITNLTFIVTDDCNYNCSYCLQKKEKKTMNNHTIETAVDFFYPLLKSDDKVRVNFYGGEPTLAFEQIQQAVLLLREKNKTGDKKIEFCVTTNGSLLTEEMLDFFDRHRFVLLLSFDGLAQDKGRKKGSLAQIVGEIKRIRQYPGIRLEINSVFSPRTIGEFSRSMRFIIEMEGPEVTFNITAEQEWNASDLATLEKELADLTDYLASYYKEKGKTPVRNFQGVAGGPGTGIFRCGAGKDHMAVTPGGELWGCYHFHDYFKTRKDSPQYREYHFGSLPDFTIHHETCYPGIRANYLDLKQDFFQVAEVAEEGEGEGGYCFLCEDMEGCAVCPVIAAYSTGTLGKISCRMCRLVKIQRKAREHFREKILSPAVQSF